MCICAAVIAPVSFGIALTIEPDHDALRSVRLRGSHARYPLDTLLITMLQEVPHPSGQRYIAVALNIAHGKGIEAVVDQAKAWLDNLLLPSSFSAALVFSIH